LNNTFAFYNTYSGSTEPVFSYKLTPDCVTLFSFKQVVEEETPSLDIQIHVIDTQKLSVSSSPLISITNPPSTIIECMVREIDCAVTRVNDVLEFSSNSAVTLPTTRVVEPIRLFPPVFYSRKSSVNYASWSDI
jgi:hypothetical protein